MNVFGGARTLRLLKFIPATLCGLLLTSCMTHGAPRNGSPETDRAFSNREARTLDLRVISSSYGALTISTAPGASCTLEVSVDGGTFGDGPPSSVEGSADRSGTLALRYPAPQIPPGRGRHVVTCDDGSRTASASADFEITSGRLDPRGLHVRLERLDAATILAGATIRLDPSLVPARDEITAYLAPGCNSAGNWPHHEPEAIHAGKLRGRRPFEPVLIRAGRRTEAAPGMTELVERDAQRLARADRRWAIRDIDKDAFRAVR